MYRGVLTGCNEAFVIDGATRQRLLDEDPNSANVIFPWLRGRDLSRWQTKPSGKFVINIQNGGNHPWPWTGKEKTEAEKLFATSYPAIYRHLQPFRKELEKRSDQGEFYWELRACAYNDVFLKPKIMWPDMAQKMRVTFDSSKTFCGNTAYFSPTDELFFLALFNSSVIAFWASKTLAVFQGNTFRFFSQNVSQFPIPRADDAARQPLRNEVAAIIAKVQADPAADISAQERKIDELVYDLYGLSTHERDIIENDIRQRG